MHKNYYSNLLDHFNHAEHVFLHNIFSVFDILLQIYLQLLAVGDYI